VSRLLRRYRSLPIRARLAGLVAAAVAFAVAAVSVTCWFIVQGKLYEQLDNDLRRTAQRPPAANVYALLAECPQKPGDTSSPYGVLRTRETVYTQLVKLNGTPCVPDESAGTVKTTEADRIVVRDAVTHGDGILRNGVDTDGNDLRVLTMPLVMDTNVGPQL